MSASNPSFAALLNAAAEHTENPLPPIGWGVTKIVSMQIFQSEQDGQSPRVSTRVVYAGPVEPNPDIDAGAVGGFFDTTFVDADGSVKLNRLAVAAGLGQMAVCISDGNGGIELNPEFAEAIKGKEVRADIYLRNNKTRGVKEPAIRNFAALG